MPESNQTSKISFDFSKPFSSIPKSIFAQESIPELFIASDAWLKILS